MQPPYGYIEMDTEIIYSGLAGQNANPIYDYTFRNVNWSFAKSNLTEALMANFQFSWLSYGDSSQNVSANGNPLYRHPPDSFIPEFSRFGYTHDLVEDAIKDGTNIFSIDFGESLGYYIAPNNSYGEFTFYIRGIVGYSEVFPKAQGSNHTIEFYDGTNTSVLFGNPLDPWDPEIDAYDDAVYRLLSQLDIDGDNKLDVKISTADLNMKGSTISEVPSLWGPSKMSVVMGVGE